MKQGTQEEVRLVVASYVTKKLQDVIHLPFWNHQVVLEHQTDRLVRFFAAQRRAHLIELLWRDKLFQCGLRLELEPTCLVIKEVWLQVYVENLRLGRVNYLKDLPMDYALNWIVNVIEVDEILLQEDIEMHIVVILC